MTNWPIKRLAVWMRVLLLGNMLISGETQAGAWPKGVPYSDPNKVKVNMSLPTPRQRFQGYDRQIIITALSDGVGVANAKLHFLHNGKKGVVNLNIPRDFVNAGRRNQAIFPIKLAQVPTQLGGLTFSTDVYLLNYSWNARKGARYTISSTGERIRVPTPADHISIVVRRAGQQIASPVVSTRRPFRIGQAIVEGPSLFVSPSQLNLSGKKNGSLRRAGASVLITLLNAKGEKRQPKGDVTFDNVRLVTASGEVHPLMDNKHGQIITQLTNDVNPKANEPIRYLFSCNFKHIPLAKGKIIFKADVSVANCWPSPVAVRIR